MNFRTPNPAIQWEKYRLRVPLDSEPLRCRSSTGRPLIAIASSSIGGANAHAVIEGAPLPLGIPAFWSKEALKTAPALLIAGGLSPRSASAIADAFAEAARDDATAVHGLARNSGRRARSMTWRSYAVAGSAGAAPEHTTQLTFSKPILTPKTRPPIVFVFSGQGTQHFHSTSVRQVFTCTSD